MNIKKIKIGIKSQQQALKEFETAYTAVQKGMKVKEPEGIYFENIKALRTFITPRRIELLSAIHRQKPESVYELAKLVKREVKSVMTDLTLLKSLGLLHLKKEKKEREHTKPFVDYDSLQVEIAV